MTEPMCRMRAIVVALALAALLPAGTAIARLHDAVDAATSTPLRVLFIGNSLTYINDLPQRVRELAAQRGQVLQVGMLARANYSLEEHLLDPAFESALAPGWDVVVLQQGPSSTAPNRLHLAHHARELVARAGDRAGRFALFAPWPMHTHRSSSQAALDSYRNAADTIGGCVLPVVSAWTLAGASRLYDPDGLHANADGTLLAALVIVRGLLGPPVPGTGETRQRLDAAAAAAYVGHATECVAPAQASPTHPVAPAEGFWAGPAAPGSGLSLERRGNLWAVAVYGYEEGAGVPAPAAWWLGTGQMAGDVLEVVAQAYEGGACIGCPGAAPSVRAGENRTVRMHFQSARRALVAVDDRAAVAMTSLPYGGGYVDTALADDVDAVYGSLPLPDLRGRWVLALDDGADVRPLQLTALTAADGVVSFSGATDTVTCASAGSERSAGCLLQAADDSSSWWFPLGDIGHDRMRGSAAMAGQEPGPVLAVRIAMHAADAAPTP